MRDDFDYATTDLVGLKAHLVQTSTQLASWQFALAKAKVDRNLAYLEAYSTSPGKSVADRRMDAEMATARDQGTVFEYEGYVHFHTTVQALTVVLLRTWSNPQVEVEG